MAGGYVALLDCNIGGTVSSEGGLERPP